jgi:hypothetical protein
MGYELAVKREEKMVKALNIFTMEWLNMFAEFITVPTNADKLHQSKLIAENYSYENFEWNNKFMIDLLRFLKHLTVDESDFSNAITSFAIVNYCNECVDEPFDYSYQELINHLAKNTKS